RALRRARRRARDPPALRGAACRGRESGDNEAHPRPLDGGRIPGGRARGSAGRRVPLARLGHPEAPLPLMTDTRIAHFNGKLMPDTRSARFSRKLMPLERISISPLDRGFIFGDGVYEVIPVYGGVPLGGREHFERLQRSMDEIQLENPHTVDEWMRLVAELLE